uniref:Uncharacterized protein n=1 Tax=Alexandrium monilatum TaxID=311494 RepID=A0A7S4QKY1_9DINO
MRQPQEARRRDGRAEEGPRTCRVALEEWSDGRLRQLQEELRQLGCCRPAERRARLRALQLELHPDKQPPELRKAAQPLFLMVQREWELLHEECSGGGPGDGQHKQRSGPQRRSISVLERLFDREDQAGRLGDMLVHVATGVGWPIGKFSLPISATMKEVKHRLQESCSIPVLRQRLQCRATLRFLDDTDLVKSLKEPRCLYLAELPYDVDRGKVLLEAARSGDTKAAERALLDQADPDFADDGWTPLLVAAWAGHVEVANLLCLVGAFKDVLAPAGETPLVLAAEGGHLGMIRFLCSVGLDKDGAARNGATPLTLASSRGLLSTVRLLCQSRADIDKAGPNGSTPLHQAARNGHVDVVRLLCRGGADRERAAGSGATPLLAAVGLGHAEVVRLLCEVGADKYCEANSYAPLHLAAAEGHLEIVKTLCAARADPLRTNEDGATPLSMALLNNRQHVVRFLA